MAARWVLTVFTDRHSSSAISMVDMLVARKRRMVSSRWVRGSGKPARIAGGLGGRLRLRIRARYGPLGRDGRVPGQQVGEGILHLDEGQDDLFPGDLDGPDEHLQGAPRILAQLRDPRAAEQRFHAG